MKTAEELQITQEELDALIEVRDWLHGPGQYSLIKESERPDLRKTTDGPRRHGFNMSLSAVVYDCGSIACIGGHVSLRMQGCALGTEMPVTREQSDVADNYVDDLKYANVPLTRLYYPTCIHWDEWDRVTPSIAAQAIDNFLASGSPRWLALAEEHSLLHT